MDVQKPHSGRKEIVTSEEKPVTSEYTCAIHPVFVEPFPFLINLLPVIGRINFAAFEVIFSS